MKKLIGGNMREPTESERSSVADRIEELSHMSAEAEASPDALRELEDALDSLLDSIDDMIRRAQDETDHTDYEMDESEGLAGLAAVESWVSFVSDALSAVYAPASPRKKYKRAGWKASAMKRVRKIAKRLEPTLKKVGRAIAVDSVSIGVGWPWGISVGVSWDI